MSSINLIPSDEQTQANCHLMPCKIDDVNGQQARAREYFWPTIRVLKRDGENEDEIKQLKRPASYENKPDKPTLLASFRGRPLQGKRIDIPDGFRGHAICHGKNQNKLCTKPPTQKHFGSFTYWNWDELPSKDDPIVKGFSWLNVAKAIHDPIE